MNEDTVKKAHDALEAVQIALSKDPSNNDILDKRDKANKDCQEMTVNMPLETKTTDDIMKKTDMKSDSAYLKYKEKNKLYDQKFKESLTNKYMNN